MSDFGDMTEDDAFDVDDLDIDALGRVFVRILRQLAAEGEVGLVLVLLAIARLLSRLQREGTS